MSDRYELENEKIRGEQIHGFLENETVRGILNGLELSYYTAWKQAATPTEREQLFATVSAFDDLMSTFRAVVASGERATHELALAEHSTPDLA